MKSKVIGLLSIFLAGVGPLAYAGKIGIDFTGPNGFGSSSGLSMPLYTGAGCSANASNGAVATSCSLDIRNNLTAEIALGFNVLVDGQLRSSIFINENGFVTFASAAPAAAPTATSISQLATQLGQSVIGPAVADMTTGNSTPFDFFSGGTGVYYQRGRGVIGAGPYVDNDPRAVNAFNIIWLSNFGTDRFVSQLILYSLGSNGDFAARFNYSADGGNDNPNVPGAFGGYSINGQTLSLSQPFDPGVDRTYRFVSSIAVPEPAALALTILGLLGLFAARHRWTI